MLIYLTLPSLFFFFLATHTHTLALAYVSKKDKKEREKKVKAMQKAADKAAKAQAKAAKKKEKEDKKKRKGSSNALAKEEEFGGFGEVPSNMPKSASASNTPYLQVGPSGKKASLSIDGGYIGVVSPHKKGSASSAEVSVPFYYNC